MNQEPSGWCGEPLVNIRLPRREHCLNTTWMLRIWLRKPSAGSFQSTSRLQCFRSINIRESGLAKFDINDRQS